MRLTDKSNLDLIIQNAHDNKIFHEAALRCGKVLPHLSEVINLYDCIEELAIIVREHLGSR